MEGDEEIDNETLGINDLPDEVLEFILSMVSPYRDAENCSLVCQRWRNLMAKVQRRQRFFFEKRIQGMSLKWTSASDSQDVESITKRYSHSAVYHDPTASMYVFGGCTSTSTTFNDLWRLELTKRKWNRCLATGTYPSPKACSVMVLYKDCLILFGGWTHPSLYPLHQSWRLFNELHSYDLYDNRWINISLNSTVKPPAMAGHSASVHNGFMVVFGGLQKQRSIGQFSSSNNIWTFDIQSQVWRQEEISEPRPSARYGQSQLYLDDRHLLILGGCGGPNNIFNDVWLLIMEEQHWRWVKCEIVNPENGAAHMWCHPSCRVGDYAVILGKRRSSLQQKQQQQAHAQARWNIIPQLRRGMNRGYGAIRRSREVPQPPPVAAAKAVEAATAGVEPQLSIDPVLGKKEVFCSSVTLKIEPPPPPPAQPQSQQQRPPPVMNYPDPNAHRMQAFATSSVKSSMRPAASATHQKSLETRQRQLDALKKMEDRLKNMNKAPAQFATESNSSVSPSQQQPQQQQQTCAYHRLALYVLDISRAIDKHVVTWAPLQTPDEVAAPEETILYSLVQGRSELILFGGIQKDVSSMSSRSTEQNKDSISNSIYFLNPPPYVV